MARLNLTLDDVTYERLGRHAKRAHSKRAALARKLIVESLDQKESAERVRALEEAYAADARDPEYLEMLREMEQGQLEIMGNEDD